MVLPPPPPLQSRRQILRASIWLISSKSFGQLDSVPFSSGDVFTSSKISIRGSSRNQVFLLSAGVIACCNDHIRYQRSNLINGWFLMSASEMTYQPGGT
jgi:hypothetical protein